jgi:hypothetical protein
MEVPHGTIIRCNAFERRCLVAFPGFFFRAGCSGRKSVPIPAAWMMVTAGSMKMASTSATMSPA